MRLGPSKDNWEFLHYSHTGEDIIFEDSESMDRLGLLPLPCILDQPRIVGAIRGSYTAVFDAGRFHTP